MTDHPRSCGANAMTGYSNRVTIGSSPLVRGQPIHVNKRLVLLDHPRSCGANDSLYHRLDFAHGSSPLVRGQRNDWIQQQGDNRIIPARAGPTCIAGQVPWCSTDHPRSCGANPTIYLVSFFCSGSSPLVRGQPTYRSLATMTSRIIPARAGPTRPTGPHRSPRSDHPRSCGANHSHKHLDRLSIGSSPLVRGQLVFVTGDFPVERIIPARAGPTVRSRISVQPSPDHPRSCGANKFEPLATDRLYGSSPLVRGQLRLRRPARIAPRIIPARAGPTFRVARASRTVSDHPRSCGANPSTSHLKHHTHGSSPLVRGQLPVMAGLGA